MMQFDRMKLGRQAKKLGFVRDTFEKVCRLADVLKFFEGDDMLSEYLALKGGTAINLTILDLPRRRFLSEKRKMWERLSERRAQTVFRKSAVFFAAD